MADPIVHITAGLPDAGTGNITTLGMTINAIASATAGQSGPLVMGAVTTAAPAYTTAQTNPLSLTTAGLLRVDGSGATQPISGSITVSGTTTVSGTVTANQGGAPWTMKPDGTAWTQTGTSANVNVTNASIPVTGTFWQATQPVSGTVTANQGGTWTVQPGNTANTTAWLVTGTGGTFPITAASLPLPSGAATSANQPSNAAAASTTSGQTGNLAMGAVTTAAPSYTTATTNNLSLTTAGALRVDGSAVTQPVSGTFWQATQPVSGTVAATQSGTWTVQPGNTANTTAWLVTGTGGTFPVTGTFWQATQPVSIAAAVSVNATQTGTWTVQQGTPPWTVGGDTASGSADANNPVKIGGVARTSNPTAVTNGQRVNGIFDKLGKLIAVGAIRDLKGVQKTSITGTSETTVVTAGAAGVFNDVYAIIVTNKSATGVSVDFKDATAGTTRMTLYAPATDTRGFTVAVDSAMVQAVAANNWTATVSSAVTSIEISMLYVSNL